MPNMLDLSDLAKREPWWTTQNGKSVPHVNITLDEREAILTLTEKLAEAEREIERLKAGWATDNEECNEITEEAIQLTKQNTALKQQVERLREALKLLIQEVQAGCDHDEEWMGDALNRARAALTSASVTREG